MPTFVGLLRAVNVGGTSRAPSTALKSAAESIGLRAVRPVLQSGNLVFGADDKPKALEARLEQAFLDTLGIQTEVMVRDAQEWAAIVDANPFRDEARRIPSHLLVVVMKRKPLAGNAAALQTYPGPERIAAKGRELYIVYPQGIARSKLHSDARWKKLGGQSTGRNWNTVLRLAAMLRQDADICRIRPAAGATD